MSKKAVVSLSGGLDSTCLLLKLLSEGYEVRAFGFNYGQKHSIELQKVKDNIQFLQNKGYKVTHQVIDLRDCFSDSASSLHEGGEKVPEGDYRDETMKSTVIENRNVIFSSIIYGKALGWANKTQDNVLISLGLHAGDHCFTEDTPILTVDGLKTVKELKIGDKIYSTDIKTGKIEIDTCVDIINKGTNDEIYKIKTTTGSIELTGLHKVYTINHGDLTNHGYDKKVEVKFAKDLKPNDILLSPYVLNNEEYINELNKKISLYNIVSDILQEKFPGCEVELDGDNISLVYHNGRTSRSIKEEMPARELLNLMAWYITEGWTSENWKRNPSASSFMSAFSQSQYKNYENCENINEMINTLGIPISFSTTKDKLTGDVKEITYQFSGLMSVLMQSCGSKSKNKCIPDWIMSFLKQNPEYIGEFINTMIEGDGHYNTISGLYSYESNSFKLIQNVSELVRMLNMYVKISYPKKEGRTYSLSFGNKNRKVGLVRFRDCAMTKIKSIDIIHKKSNVYDLSVKKNHNFFAGDLGNILISNSIYPDCRPESQEMARELFRISNWGSERVDYEAPFINIDKGEVLHQGIEAMHKMNFSDDDITFVLSHTHSCYAPDAQGRSCGKCGTCVERIESFQKNGMKDPIEYQ